MKAVSKHGRWGSSPPLNLLAGRALGIAELRLWSEARSVGQVHGAAGVGGARPHSAAAHVESTLVGAWALRDADEMMVKAIMIEGILSIQSGDNPRIVKDKLSSFLPPAERAALDESTAGA